GQKLGEAEVFMAAGRRDILIPYNIIGAQKLDRLCRLAKQAREPVGGGGAGRMTVCVDSAYTAEGISRAAHEAGVEIGVEVECDTGMHRAGVQSPQEAADLASRIARLPGLQLRGWMTYPTTPETAAFFEEASRLIASDGLTAE